MRPPNLVGPLRGRGWAGPAHSAATLPLPLFLPMLRGLAVLLCRRCVVRGILCALRRRTVALVRPWRTPSLITVLLRAPVAVLLIPALLRLLIIRACLRLLVRARLLLLRRRWLRMLLLLGLLLPPGRITIRLLQLLLQLLLLLLLRLLLLLPLPELLLALFILHPLLWVRHVPDCPLPL